MSDLTLGSLFDGSGGFPLGGMLAGIKPLWSSEIEMFPIMHEERSLGEPSQAYVDVCREGYREFGFNERFIDKAIERSVNI